MGICSPEKMAAGIRPSLPAESSIHSVDQQDVTVVVPPNPPFIADRHKRSIFLSASGNDFINKSRPQHSDSYSILTGTALGNSSSIDLLIYENQQLKIKRKYERRATTVRKNRTEIRQFHIVVLMEANWSSLTKLGINNSKIGNKGCKWLSRAKVPFLEKLGLRENEIQTEGLLHLSKMTCHCLTQFYLAGNKIVLGLKWLMQVTMPSIAYLNLENNLILPLEIDYVLISKHRNLSLVDLTWNRIENLKEKEKKKRLFAKRYCRQDHTDRILHC